VKACKVLKNIINISMGKSWDDVGSINDKLRFLNYGESPRCLATAGISLSVHTLIAQNYLKSPLLEMPRERLIITNDRFTASFDKKPNRDRRKLSLENKKTDPGRLAREYQARLAERGA